MLELRFIIRIIRATSACAKQREIRKKASFSDGRVLVICQFVICVEALRKEQRGWHCYVQTFSEEVEMEREFDKQLWNHIKGQHASAFASKTVLWTWCTHIYSLHMLFFDFGRQKRAG